MIKWLMISLKKQARQAGGFREELKTRMND